MKVNSVSLKFVDVDAENANMVIVFDPPLDENVQPPEFEEQPCLALANLVLNFLGNIQRQEIQAEENKKDGKPDGGSGSNLIIVH